MEITDRSVAALTVLDLRGVLTISGGAELREKTECLVLQGRHHIVVNLAAVPYINSGGLGQLIACHTTLARAGGRLTLINLNARNRYLLSITKLISIFETFDTEGAAIESYAAA